jgi:hypothetical protein
MVTPAARATVAWVRLLVKWGRARSARMGKRRVADAGHPGSEPQLRVAVAGRDVEVVDAGVQCELDRAVGGRLVDRRERGPAIDEDGAHVAKTTQPTLLHDACSSIPGETTLVARQS